MAEDVVQHSNLSFGISYIDITVYVYIRVKQSI